jgi:O-acetyl-ADP-ribose deacetylase (regulator of RNase III)
MIRYTSGDLLRSGADALVNPVNTVGVMGAGLAAQFKRAYPAMFDEYRRTCASGKLSPGTMHVWATGRREGPRFVVNFPTKPHWRNDSKIEDIAVGLDALVSVAVEHGFMSLAVPALGCGLGGLPWEEVRPLIEAKLSVLPEEVAVAVYVPGRGVAR